MWTLQEAQDFIKLIQARLNKHNYHVCLGGGVLNNGQSTKDLDLYFLPLEDDSANPEDKKEWTPLDVLTIMHDVTKSFGISINEEYTGLRTTYQQKVYYEYNDKRIDCFIM